MRRKQTATAGFILLALSFTFSYTYNQQAGNGGDGDARTFHFFPTNKNGQLAKSDLTTPISNGEALTLYGDANGYNITLDGISIPTYGWNFQTDTDGIGDTRWLSSSYPSAGQFRIDTTRGRIKSNPALNWKYAVTNGLTPATTLDSSGPILSAFEKYFDGTNEKIVGIIVGRQTAASYGYYTLEMDQTCENTDDFTSTLANCSGGGDTNKGWRISTFQALTSITAGDTCKELDSDTDLGTANARVAWGLWCDNGTRGLVYGIEYNAGAFTAALKSSNGSLYSEMTKHVAVAVLGSTNTAYWFWGEKTSVGSINSQIQCIPAGGPCQNANGNSAGGGSAGVGYSFKSGTTDALNLRCADVIAGGATQDTEFHSAFDPDIDCYNDVCYVAYVQEMIKLGNSSPVACGSGSLASLYPQMMAMRADTANETATSIHSKIHPFKSEGVEKNREPHVVAISSAASASAMVVFKQRPDYPNATYTLVGAIFDGTGWPRHSTNGGATGSETVVTQVSDFNNDVGIRQIIPKLSSGNDVSIFWTQADEADSLANKENAEAQYLCFRRWRFGNINNTSKDLRFDTLQRTRAEDANMYSFDWTYFKAGAGYLTFVQNQTLYFGIFNGVNLPSSFESIGVGTQLQQSNLTYPLAHSSAIAYGTRPLPSASKPAEGRVIPVWYENGKIYSRSYYNYINLQVNFFSQDYGTVLTPSGEKPPLVRNNYSRPGDSRPVDIFINDRSASEKITVEIYTMDGKLVRRILDAKAYNSFAQPVQWDKKTKGGTFAASGIYQVVITSDQGLKLNHPIIIVR